MSDKVTAFNANAGEKPVHADYVEVLKKQDWELGFMKGRIPTLYIVTERTPMKDMTQLALALQELGVDYTERFRSSNGERVLEVQAENFARLSNVIGVDRVNKLEHDLKYKEYLREMPWQSGLKGGTAATMMFDLTETKWSPDDIQRFRSLLSYFDISTSTRTRSSNKHEVLEVMGDSLMTLQKIVKNPEMERILHRPTPPRLDF